MSYIEVPYIFVGAGLSTLSCIWIDISGVQKTDVLVLEALDYTSIDKKQKRTFINGCTLLDMIHWTNEVLNTW